MLCIYVIHVYSDNKFMLLRLLCHKSFLKVGMKTTKLEEYRDAKHFEKKDKPIGILRYC